MKRVIIFGNSGSGKSTLAKALCASQQLAHLDLDTLAWLPTAPPQRTPLSESQAALQQFMDTHSDWVIEGCYSDLIGMALPRATEVIYLDLPVELCVANARARPWEPHKYASKAAQDANLPMLLDWIRDYDARDDVFSRQAHEKLFNNYNGRKSRLTRNEGNH